MAANYRALQTRRGWIDAAFHASMRAAMVPLYFGLMVDLNSSS